jgi:hypothetical protein
MHIGTFFRLKQVRSANLGQFSAALWSRIRRGRTNSVHKARAGVSKSLI